MTNMNPPVLRLGILLVCAIQLNAAAAADDGSRTSIADLEARILAARKTIKSGVFTIEVSRDHYCDVSYHIWISQDGRVRQERRISNESQVSIFANDFAYYYSSKIGRFENPDPTLRPPIERIPVKLARRDELPHLICNPLVAMFVPLQYTLLARYDLDALVNGPGRENIKVRDASWNGLPAFTVAFTLSKTGDKYEYDVVPARDHNIVSWRSTGTLHSNAGGAHVYENSVSCELAQIPGSVWFPVHMTLKRIWNKKPELDEDVAITTEQVNNPIPDKVFSLAWGNVPAGRRVIEKSMYGNASTKPSTRPAPQAALISADKRSWIWPMRAALALCLIVGLALIFGIPQRLRRRA